MAPRRVIEDSDSDDGGSIATEMLSPSVDTNEAGVIPVMHSSSTDPMLFRAVYEEHFGQLVGGDQLHSHRQSPVFEDPIIDQHMTSSASITSGRKLKRSKTATESSSSFATESTLSNRKIKLRELMRNVDDLTQITSTGISNDAILQDPWEVPPSSISDQPSYVNTKVKSKVLERNNNRKTCGRQIRRAQTVSHTAQMTSNEQRWSSPLEDETSRNVNQDRSAQDQEVVHLPTPRPKRLKIESTSNGDLPEHVQKVPPDMVHKEAFPGFSNSTTRTGVTSISIQAKRSVSEHSNIGSSKSAAVYVHGFSSPPFTVPTDSEAMIRESYILENSLATRVSRKAIGPIVIVPDALSDEQKLQYDIVSVASTSQSRRSSLPEILETHHSNIQHIGYSSTVSNVTLVPESTLATFEDGLPAKSPPSSPPLSVTKRKLKRAKSEVGSKQKSISAMPSSHGKAVKKKGRSKTLTQGGRRSCREASVDELSLTSEEFVRSTISSKAFTNPRMEGNHGEDRGEPTRTEEIHTLGATNLTEELYQSRHSPLRSERISVDASTDDYDLRVAKARFNWEVSAKAKDADGFVADFTAEVVPEGTLQQTENSTPRKIADVDDTNQKSENILVFQTETMAALPAQTKKRGRKKTSEVVAIKSHYSSVASPSKNHDAQRKALCEMDSNQKSSQEIPSASQTKEDILPAQPAQTPTRDSKKVPGQHSPIQGGKVPYRVGLSKKTRIAPLLKMIRK